MKMWTDPIMQSIVMLDSFDKRHREYKRLGWVYAARNPCFADPVFKVGQTKVSPVSRVKQLSSSTSVYRPFELASRWHGTGYADQPVGEDLRFAFAGDTLLVIDAVGLFPAITALRARGEAK